ncbi:MAG: sigma-70 family RNA polymerase sigma factor [Patescibacteria group bacterium]|jgi:RNA polymerase sigma-70 factor (ECF subfamily)
MEKTADEKLVADYLSGKEQALEELVARYFKAIYGFVFGYVRNQDEAEDLTQVTFIKAWRGIKRFDCRKNFKVWLFTIAKNTALDYLKKKKPLNFSAFENDEGDNMLAETLADPGPLPDEIFERNDLSELLAEAVNNLPAQYQPVIRLHHVAGFSLSEIAEITGQPLNTVKSRHRRALLLLREYLIKKFI